MNVLRTSIIALAATVATLAGTAAPALADADGTYWTTDIVEFEQVDGNSAGAGRAEQRVLDAEWGFDDGEFTFDTPGLNSDLYPLTGSYTVDDDVVTFEASSSVSYPTGSASAEISGEMDTSTGELSFHWIRSSGNAAVVNGIGFSGATSSGYTGVVEVE